MSIYNVSIILILSNKTNEYLQYIPIHNKNQITNHTYLEYVNLLENTVYLPNGHSMGNINMNHVILGSCFPYKHQTKPLTELHRCNPSGISLGVSGKWVTPRPVSVKETAPEQNLKATGDWR